MKYTFDLKNDIRVQDQAVTKVTRNVNTLREINLDTKNVLSIIDVNAKSLQEE